MSESKNELLKSFDFKNFKKEYLNFEKLFTEFSNKESIQVFANIYPTKLVENISLKNINIENVYFWSIKDTEGYNFNVIEEYCFFGVFDLLNSEYKYNYILFTFKIPFNYENQIVKDPKLYLSPSIDYIEGVLSGLDLYSDFLKFQENLKNKNNIIN